MDTAKVIIEARKGSAVAQKYCFDKYADRMLIVCRRYVKNIEDAEECLLDGFRKFFSTLNSFRFETDEQLAAWLRRIMINECLMFLRKKHVFNIVSETAAEEISVPPDAFDNISANEICKLIMQLPTGYRTVFNLFVVEGYDHRSIAEMLNINEGTSKSQLSKARSLLQKMIYTNETDHVARASK